jgi:hypothetical protein
MPQFVSAKFPVTGKNTGNFMKFQAAMADKFSSNPVLARLLG